MRKINAHRGLNLHQKRHQNLNQNVHSLKGWDRYGVVWAKNPNKGFDLLVLTTNNHPPATDSRRCKL